MVKNKKYEDWLLEKLKDHDQAVAYLNDALEESLKGDEKVPTTLSYCFTQCRRSPRWGWGASQKSTCRKREPL